MSGRLLITGGSGFIGRHVAEEAIRRGYRVTGLDRNDPHTDGIDVVKADIRDKDRVRQVVKDQDYVIHLAAITSNVEFIKSPADCYDINANGFLNVLDCAASSGCRRFVYASSAAVYLDTFSEDAPLDVRKRGNHYAKTKIMNEMVAKSYEHIHGMRTIGLRYFNVYGHGENDKGDYASIVTLFLKAKNDHRDLLVYGDGRQARDLVHVADAARVTLDLLEKGSDDVYNVGTGVATAYAEIAAMIDEHHVRYVPNPLPDYQYYTKAETSRLKGALGSYAFIGLREGMRDITPSAARATPTMRAAVQDPGRRRRPVDATAAGHRIDSIGA
jgi:UDP-glucose 4-epimerase